MNSKNKSTINLTEILTYIIHDISQNCNTFSHIDTERLLVCLSSNKHNGRGATFGKLLPLRFEDGNKRIKFRGRLYQMPRVLHQKKEQLYIIYFYIPRFFDLNTEKKLRVIFHELYHISPEFNGDIRRMTRHKAAHGHSKEKFDEHFEEDASQYLKTIKGTKTEDFLKMKTNDFYKHFSKVLGNRMKMPKPELIK